jgi:hypothetical protein
MLTIKVFLIENSQLKCYNISSIILYCILYKKISNYSHIVLHACMYSAVYFIKTAVIMFVVILFYFHVVEEE